MRVSKSDKKHSMEMLHKFLQPGSTVYTVRPGMSRQIDFYTFQDNIKIYLTGYISDVLETPRDAKSGALRVSGCGMDMGFSVVYNLGRVLFPGGFDTTHGRNGDTSGHDNDGGYALKQEWI